MMLDPEHCHRAIRARDRSFDGRFFTCVRTTGIYCRPVCPAPAPRIANCLFVPSAAAAAEAGFRPCLRCRPETAPGTPAWLGTSATVSRALRLIEGGGLDGTDVASLAESVGVGERHLRRLFLEHLGASPAAVARTRRLLFAKQLIDETSLKMGELAHAAGYSSLRRFNDAVVRAWGRPPRELRRSTSRAAMSMDSGIELKLPFRPPLCWSALARFLGARAIPGVEVVAEEAYRRTMSVGGVAGIVEVRPAGTAGHLVARIEAPSAVHLIDIVARVRRLFDLDGDPDAIDACLSRDSRLQSVLAAVPGLRVPGAWDGFEMAVRAILGQQVSVQAARMMAGSLARNHGPALPVPCGDLTHLFPGPDAVARVDPASLGMPRSRAAALVGLARAVSEGRLDLERSRGLEESVQELRKLPGIGEWTAQVIALRALREPDAFPAGDLGLRRALGNGERLATEDEVRRAGDAWRPWRGKATIALWTWEEMRGCVLSPEAAGAGPVPRRSRRALAAG